MKTLFILLLALACAMTMPQGKDSSEESGESSEENKEESGEELEDNEDFVITASCFVEASDLDGNLDEPTLEKCVQCFEEADALGEGEDAVEETDPTTSSMDATTSCPGVLAAPLSHRARLRNSAGRTG